MSDSFTSKDTGSISIQRIVDDAPIVLNEKDPALVFVNKNSVIIKKEGGSTSLRPSYPSFYIPPTSGGNIVDGDLTQDQPIDIKPDVPSLTDIEKIDYVQYYDTITKGAKIKAIIKIRNSSIKGTSVQGVDARVYNPNA